jgi:CHASE2 domain-containing sensor protein
MKLAFGKQTSLLFKDTLKCMVFSAAILMLMFGLTHLINFGSFDLYRLAFKEFSFLDTFYAQKMDPEATTVNKQLILVNVKHLNREQIARLINKIDQQQPKVIGVDVIFDHSKQKDSDVDLWMALQSKNIVATYAFQDRGLIENHPRLMVLRHKMGYANFNFDTYNSVIRNFQAKTRFENQEYTSFGLLVAQQYLGKDQKLEWVKMDRKSIPINYSGGSNHYYTFEANEVLEQKAMPVFKDKIVLLGYLGSPTGNQNDIEDRHFTPLNPEFVGKSAPDTFGLVVHANIIEMLINNKRLKEAPVWVLFTVGFLLTFMAIAFFLKLNKNEVQPIILIKKLAQLGFTVFFIWIALWLLSNGIYFKITELIWYAILSVGYIWAYKLMSNYMKNRFGWKSYFFQD